FAREIDATCREIGFFTITGHGVPVATMNELRSKAHTFFALPLEEKRRAIHPVAGTPRGYRAQGLEAARRRPTSRSSTISAGEAAKRAVLHGSRRSKLFHTESVAAEAGGVCDCGCGLLCGNGATRRAPDANDRARPQPRRTFFRAKI